MNKMASVKSKANFFKMQNNIFFLIVIIGLSCVNAQIEQGDQLMKTGNWKAAIEAYKNESASADKEFRLAQAYNQLGNTFQAIQFYENGFKNDSVSIKPQYEYGKLLINSQQYITAIPVFQNLNTSQPENASFHYYLGEAWSGVNQIDLAIQSYKQALSLNEEYRVARLDLIKNYIQKGNFKKAIDIAKQGVAMDSTDVKVNSYLAQAYVNSKWYDKAIPVFEKLFELDNDTEYNRSTLAFSYFSEKEFEKAIENYQIFIKDYSDKKPSVYFHMSVAFMKLEKYPEAIESIEKAITLRRTLLDQE